MKIIPIEYHSYKCQHRIVPSIEIVFEKEKIEQVDFSMLAKSLPRQIMNQSPYYLFHRLHLKCHLKVLSNHTITF